MTLARSLPNSVLNYVCTMGRSRKFCQRGSKFDKVFFFFFQLMGVGGWGGIEDPNTDINGPSSAPQQNAIEWRFAGGQMLAQH